MLPIVLLFFILGCHSPSKEALISEAVRPASTRFSFEFLGDQILPRDFSKSKYEFGGISGLHWSALDKTLVLAVSDDRGRNGPTRFYRLRIEEADKKLPQLRFEKEVIVLGRDGKAYPERSFDTEGIAEDTEGHIYISSEGDFTANESAVPGILKLSKTGQTIGYHKVGPPVFPADGNWKRGSFGVRDNSSLESLDIYQKKNLLVTANENSLFQDGKMAGKKHGANVRLFVYDIAKEFPGSMVKQNVYPLSKTPGRDIKGRAKMGVTDIYVHDLDQYFVIERAYLSGRSKNRVQLYFADCSSATDVKSKEALKGQEFLTCQKELVYDFDAVLGNLSDEHPRVDNLEGIAFGPKAKDGSQLMFLIADNNFSSGAQKTQVLYFRVKPSL